MKERSRQRLLIIADAPEALTDLCGISLLERTRRIALYLGFREAMILSSSLKAVSMDVAKQSWHRGDVSLMFRERLGAKVTIGDILDGLAEMGGLSDERILIVFAGFYCDLRLLRSLAHAQTNSALIDSDPPFVIAPLLQNSHADSSGQLFCATLLSREWLTGKDRADALVQEIASDTVAGRITSVDAAQQQSYIESMRRSVRPVFFPAPSLECRPLAERLLHDATQKGVLDFPALVHAPIEKWLVSLLCRTAIAPNHITLGTGILGLGVTLLYAGGHLWTGALLALIFGVLDGVDGKLARLKVQMTKAGKREHLLDFFVEMSWWTALAYHFHGTGQVPYAYVILLGFFAFHALERVGRGSVQRRVGRSLDDFSPFDRLVRRIAGRRNVYTWLFTFFLILGAPATGFIWLCFWGMASAAIHIFRAWQILYAGHDKVASTVA